ncbi:polysaccharide pyruvyl transferase family protein [Jeotgalibaca sp. A122]|uniref:polysaccharide pyruvyl transferase family protein n=1 Tax=Jeotgalibaca sp. A122 TaxID=3457322 RepID=UPI003FD10B16
MKQFIKKMAPAPMLRAYRRYKKRDEIHYFNKRYKQIVTHLSESKDTERIILIGTSVYGNLGDQAISSAEIAFLDNHFPDRKIIEIPNTMYFYNSQAVKSHVKDSDILLINGGGFMGTLWPEAEEMARDVVRHFKNNRIIIMPQTIYFSKDEKGQQELLRSKEVYQNHADLTLFVRDLPSFEFANANLKGKNFTEINLMPDIVTFIKKDVGPEERNQIMFCMRNDKEKIDNNEQLIIINKYLSDNNSLPIQYRDTVVEEQIDLYNRADALTKTYHEFRKSKLIITDRLHGMVISAITGTPCLALNNISGKVRGQYEWIKHLNYIYYVEDVSEIPEKLASLLKLEETAYNNEELLPYFDKLAQTIEQGSNSNL